jgi:hypothetical protein
VSDLSVHEHTLVGYEVDCTNRRIVLHAERDEGGSRHKTDVVFEGVQGYLIRDSLESVLRGIDVVSAEYLLEQFSSQFERGRNYGWPGRWNTPETNTERHLLDSGLTAWLIMTNSHFDGFVIALSMSKVAGA